jgi:hypothetical protein
LKRGFSTTRPGRFGRNDRRFALPPLFAAGVLCCDRFVMQPLFTAAAFCRKHFVGAVANWHRELQIRSTILGFGVIHGRRFAA